MSDPQTAPAPQPPPPRQKSNVGKYIAFGCLGVLLLAGIGGYLAYRGIKGFIVEMAEQYASPEPLELPTATLSEEDRTSLFERVNSFGQSLEANEPTPPLVLTADDLNALIQNHPDWSQLADKVYVSIEDDQIQGQASVPLGEFFEPLEGRYLNAAVGFSVEMSAGQLAVYIDSAQVGGQDLPDAFMEGLRSENLAQEAHNDQDFAAMLEKLDSITVQDGALHITPKNVP